MTSNIPPELSDPHLDPVALAHLAQQRPDLWPQIRQHPSIYPGLDAWIVQQSTTSTQPFTTTTPSNRAAFIGPTSVQLEALKTAVPLKNCYRWLRLFC